ncbi:unnamed protein product [Effrenium voratum]|nr:unnamed protein product [Effrenium voratum]
MVLERSSTSFQLDEHGRVVGVARESSSSTSHHLVEELMVLANHVVAERLVEGAATTGKAAGEASVPRALLRCHPDTLPEVKKALLEVLPEELKHSAPMDEPLPALLQWSVAQGFRQSPTRSGV